MKTTRIARKLGLDGNPLRRRTDKIAARFAALLLADEAVAAVVAPVAPGIALLCLAWARRRVLDRRRLADWEATWAAVGPEWTRRYRSRG